MKRLLGLYRPAILVPGLFALYVLITLALPSPFASLVLGLAVIIAAHAWGVAGGVVAALATIPPLALGFWRLLDLEVLAAIPGSRTFLLSWMLRAYLLGWIAMLAVGLFVGYLSRQTGRLAGLNQELKQAQQRLTALHQIALSLSTTLDVGRLLDTVLDQLGQLWGYDHGAVVLYDEATDELMVAAARGYEGSLGHRFPSTAGISGAVFRTGQPAFVPDVSKDHRYLPGVAGARSEMAVPLVWEGRILGVLNVESRIAGAYGAADLDLLATVAEQAAAAIGNARLHQRTRDMAIRDAHTGLFNYRHFQEQLAATVRDAQLTGAPCSLVMLDLDLFKRCNDTYGHLTGDSVLQQLSRVLRDSCRSEDLLFRYGGEEFTLILPGAPEDTAILVAERIRERVAAYPFVTRSGRRLDFPITVSLGVAAYPRDGLSQVDLLIAADTALYAAKAAGRNRVMTARQGAAAVEPA